VHAVLVDVFGVGVLILGKSGIGKSEVGLELVAAGHRLVSDDVVILEQESATVVVGFGPDLTKFHMEIRGLGILNIKDLFGAASVRERKRVELICELVEWDPEADYDRVGLDTRRKDLAGVPVVHLTLPVRPGRSLKLIIEVAARDRLLKAQGTHSAQAFAARLDTMLKNGEPPPGLPLRPDKVDRE
jgi:HPr kinase/phosphorylase